VAVAAERPRVDPGHSLSLPHPKPALVAVQEAALAQLLECLLGPDVEVSNATLTAAPGAAGLFSGGASVIGIDQGIILSSGNIVTLVGPNLLDDTSYDNNYAGDADLDGLIPGYTTYDATILEFDFSCADPTAISFQYVFGSEEYNEWVASPFNDVFGFFLNGQNIALVPTVCSNPGIPVAINNVNCDNPYDPPRGSNCDCFRNNDLNDGGGLIDTEMDGTTQVFYATAQIQPGTNHMKIAIADAGDRILDSNVMIHCQSFVCGAAPATGACCIGLPFDDDCFFLSREQCLAQGGYYFGDGVPCSPNPCSDMTGVDGAGVAPPLDVSVWPNPSTGEALIVCRLPRPTTVTLDIFATSGSRVVHLSQGFQPAGPYTLSWDGRDGAGRALPAGIYFARITTAVGTAMTKVTVVR
jgi:hypothetical protein